MARKRKGRAVNGVLLFNKAVGASSNQMLQKVRWLYQAQKAGHGGTLDPFADGVLPILFGEATKFGQYLLGADKRYTVRVRFGRETDTDDCEGKVIRETAIPALADIDWAEVLEHFQGNFLQMPPIFSALKVHGQRAYTLAREGKIPELAPRPVHFHEINLLEVGNDFVCLDVLCSKGTYIRALARDIGQYIESSAHAERLTRTAVGNFDLSQACDLTALEPLEYDELDALLLPVDMCVKDLAALTVPADKVRFIRHGNDVAIQAMDGKYALFDAQTFFGVGTVENGRLYPNRLCALSESK